MGERFQNMLKYRPVVSPDWPRFSSDGEPERPASWDKGNRPFLLSSVLRALVAEMAPYEALKPNGQVG